jgi:TRAP-type C4-dicarboxylate transport system substrate-binding protein
LATDRPINSVADLSGVNLLSTTINPVMIETAKSFGCNTVPCVIRDYNSVSEVSSQPGVSIETTLPRYEHESNTKIQKYITNTKHSMYLTSILISKEFWNSLDQEDQAFVKQAAVSAGVQEREWSVNESADFALDAEKHEKLGISYKEFPEEEVAKLKEIVMPLYDKYAQFFSPGLIDGIIRA